MLQGALAHASHTLSAISPRQADKSPHRQQRLVKFQIGESGPESENPHRYPNRVRFVNFLWIIYLISNMLLVFGITYFFMNFFLYFWSHTYPEIFTMPMYGSLIDIVTYSSQVFKTHIDL